MKELFLFAGEVSGDELGARLLMQLRQLSPHTRFWGVGGDKMRRAGLEPLLPMEAFEVMGFLDVALALPRLYKLFQKLKEALRAAPPQVAVLIDYPDFNLLLARFIRKRTPHIRPLQYVCPSVWAWRPGRVKSLVKRVDRLLSILPFEPDLFHDTPLPTTYVGHPLIERLDRHRYNPKWRNTYPIAPSKLLLSLFPGSRRQEIKRNLPLQLQVAHQVTQHHPHYHVTISCARAPLQPLIRSLLAPDQHKSCSIIAPDDSYNLMRESHLALATSGTVILELALHKIPTIVTYVTGLVDLCIARYLLRIDLPYYSLPNILLRRELFPEYFGIGLQAESIQEAVEKLILSQVTRERYIEGCSELRASLGSRHASEIAAQEIVALSRSDRPTTSSLPIREVQRQERVPPAD